MSRAMRKFPFSNDQLNHEFLYTVKKTIKEYIKYLCS